MKHEAARKSESTSEPPQIEQLHDEHLEMINDYQDWAVEYEHQPGKQSILSSELIQFYVKSYVEELI